MKHILSLVIAIAIFIFTSIYAYLVAVNSVEISGMNLLLQVLLIIFIVQWLAYIPAFLLKTEKFYDLTGSLTYIGIFIYCLTATNSIEHLKMGNIVVAVAVIIWASRLGSFLLMRVIRDGKDGRFTVIKRSFSRFFLTWTLQGMWVFICASAALVAITSTTGVSINIIFFIGLLLFIFGFVIEAIADRQKSAFRAMAENKDKFINQGLWRQSRHPNYFGEITLWAGISAMSISSFSGMSYLALFSPVFTYLLLNYISGVSILEQRGEKRWGHLPEYQHYRKTTPKFIPKLSNLNSG